MPSLSEVFNRFIEFSAGLSPVELWVVMSLIFLLFLYLAYRIMGLGGLFGVLLVGFFAYVLFDHDAFGMYKEKEAKEADRMKMIDEELYRDVRE